MLTGDGELTLLLASGHARSALGDSGDLRLKLAIAKQLLPLDERRGATWTSAFPSGRSPATTLKSQVEV